MLMATIFLFLGLSRYHELTAMKAAGVSLYRVSAPILGMGLLMAVGAALFQELVLPKLNELGHEVDRIKIRGQQPRHLQTLTRLWLRSADSRFYRVELVAPSTGELYGMTLLELDRDFRLLRRLDAQQAHWTRQAGVVGTAPPGRSPLTARWRRRRSRRPSSPCRRPSRILRRFKSSRRP
jgi:lipopolysaccharide export system permease protein